MGAAPEQLRSNVSPELDEFRLLTEFDNLVRNMRPDGSVPAEVLHDEKINLKTAVYEIALPQGVTTTIHRAEYVEDAAGKRKRMFMFMGKNLVENAMGGTKFHSDPAAHDRVLQAEVPEAAHTQDTLRPGYAQAFISPKMSRSDASEQIAKAEHLHADDSLRVSKAIIDSKGAVVGRRLESLLVRDIPLEAWVALLRDPNNMFGKVFNIENEQSALSVMKLFQEMELPEELIPEGPITFVAAVQKYIKDNVAHDSVGRQLEGFRHDQELYEQQAELAANQWLEFELELARSFKMGGATNKIQDFITSLQHHWDDEALAIIGQHHRGDNRYTMTRPLAAVLERAKRNLLTSQAAIATKNERVMAQLRPGEGQALYDQIHSLQILRANQLISEQEFARQQANLEQKIAGHNIKGGGGCPDDAAANFRNIAEPTGPERAGSNEDESSGKKLMSCPFCSAKVFDDPCAVVLSCWDCRATVVNGKVVSKGDGGSKARVAARKAAEKATQRDTHSRPVERDLAQQVDAVFEERKLEFPPEAAEAQSRPAQTASYVKPLAQLALNK
jgi:hypothetical protein